MLLIHTLFVMVPLTTGLRCLMRPLKNIYQQSSSTARYMAFKAGEKSKISIVGGGFGGLYTALKLDAEGDFDVTLIDGKDKFVFLPLLYELAVGTANILEVAPRFDTLLKDTNVKFVQGTVSNINLQNKVLTIDNKPNDVEFDQLVVSVGARPRTDIIPGARQYALPFYTIEDAYKLRKYLNLFKTSSKPIIRIAVIGGGYSGVEVATSIVQSLGKDRVIVSLIDRNDRVMHTSPTHNRMTAEKSLNMYGISINCNTSVQQVFDDKISLTLSTTGESFDLPVDLVICTAGVQQTKLVEDLPLTKDASGRLLTERTLQCKDTPFVFALGDCSSVEGEKFPSTGQVAMQQANIVATNLAIRARTQEKLLIDISEELKPTALQKFRFVDLGEMLTLGASTDAAVTGMGGLFKLEGLPAAVARRLVYAYRMPTPKQAANAFFGASLGLAGSVINDILVKGK